MFYFLDTTNTLNGWFLCTCHHFIILFVSIFLHKSFTSSADTIFKLFRKVAVTPGPVPSSHLPPRTSGIYNFLHHLPGCITCHLEWEHIRLPSLCVDQPSSRLHNRWITYHIEWEHIFHPGLCICVLLQDGLEIIVNSRWNWALERKSMKLYPFILFSVPLSPPLSVSDYEEQPHSL